MLKFKQREVVVIDSREKNPILVKEVDKLNVEYIGEKCELNYSIGDEVLVDFTEKHKKLKWEGKNYLIFDERFIICGI